MLGVVRQVKGAAALLGIPFGSLMLAALVLNIMEPDWEPESCRWCEWVMGGAGIVGLIIGAGVAARIWSVGKPPTEATAQRNDFLLVAWFWTAIVTVIFLGGLVKQEWFAVLAAMPGAALAGWFFWTAGRRSTPPEAEEPDGS